MEKRMSKVSTLWSYLQVSLSLGADPYSRWQLALMLPRLELMRALRRPDRKQWQVKVKLGDRIIPLFLRTNDIFILKEIWRDNPYCPQWLRELSLSKVLDLGAHIGLATLRFKLCFPHATIHCYEPDVENFRLLSLNTQTYKDVILHPEAVGSTSGETVFYIHPDQHSSSSLHKPSAPGQAIEIPCIVRSLDDILTDIGRVDLIKFDIEGAEKEVFASSQLVHEIPYLVGEIKASDRELQEFLILFPYHKVEIINIASKMHFIHLQKR